MADERMIRARVRCVAAQDQARAMVADRLPELIDAVFADEPTAEQLRLMRGAAMAMISDVMLDDSRVYE